VPWNALELSSNASFFSLELKKGALPGEVAFTNARWPDLVDERWAKQTHQAFDAEPFWSDDKAGKDSNDR
jgi:hypothetical protein